MLTWFVLIWLVLLPYRVQTRMTCKWNNLSILNCYPNINQFSWPGNIESSRCPHEIYANWLSTQTFSFWLWKPVQDSITSQDEFMTEPKIEISIHNHGKQFYLRKLLFVRKNFTNRFSWNLRCLLVDRKNIWRVFSALLRTPWTCLKVYFPTWLCR